MKNVLLVDDSRSARLMLKKMLEKNSLAVELAESGEEAIVYLQSCRPDVIFMDHLMAGMDGLEVAKIISSDPKTKDIPIVMCTSKEGDEYIVEARAHGAAEILGKPPTLEQVKRVISSLTEMLTNRSSGEMSEAQPNIANESSPSSSQSPAGFASVDKALVVSTIDSILESRWAELNDRLKEIISGIVGAKIETELESALSSWQDGILIEATIHTEQAVKQSIENDMDKLQSQIRSLAEIIDQLQEEGPTGTDQEEQQEWKDDIANELNALAKRLNKVSVMEDTLTETIDNRIQQNSQTELLTDKVKQEIIEISRTAMAEQSKNLVLELEESLAKNLFDALKDSIKDDTEKMARNIASVTATAAAKDAMNKAMENFNKNGSFSIVDEGKSSHNKRWLFVGILLTLAAAAGISYYYFDLIPFL